MSFIEGSTFSILQHADEILTQNKNPLGYHALAAWVKENAGRVRPAMYVALYAEAVRNNVSIQEVEEAFPRARFLAEYLISSMNNSHPDLMAMLRFQFSTRLSLPR